MAELIVASSVDLCGLRKVSLRIALSRALISTILILTKNKRIKNKPVDRFFKKVELKNLKATNK